MAENRVARVAESRVARVAESTVARVAQSRVARVAVLQFSRSLRCFIRVRGFCLVCLALLKLLCLQIFRNSQQLQSFIPSSLQQTFLPGWKIHHWYKTCEAMVFGLTIWASCPLVF